MTTEHLPPNNLILPFQIERTNLRGRIVRVGSILDEILTLHDYPKPVAHMVAESITLSLALSSMLKFDGVFTLQAQGDGPVGTIVSDVRTPATVRGCAHFDAERVEQAREQLAAMATPEAGQNHLAQYLGKGHMAFTIDMEGSYERQQGIVSLEGASLIDCVQNYFQQSEQIGTGLHMAVGQRNEQWRSCVIMLQRMPENLEEITLTGNTEVDGWRRAMILMQSATENEMLSEDLPVTDLLIRLFHEDGVRIFDPVDITRECRCSAETVQDVVRTLPDEDRRYMIKKGAIEMKCEFCSRIYKLNPKTLDLIE